MFKLLNWFSNQLLKRNFLNLFLLDQADSFKLLFVSYVL